MVPKRGKTNSAFESHPPVEETREVHIENSHSKSVADQNAEPHKQLDFSPHKTEASSTTVKCKVDRKILIVIIGVIVLLIVVVIALSVYLAMQNNGSSNSGWEQWSSWGICSLSCGMGVHQRLRLCKKSECPGPDRQTQNCTYTVHCPTDGAWAQWSNWSSCSATCGNGNMFRTRTCTDPAPQYGGQECTGSNEQSQSCIVNCPVHGAWSPWTPWSSCSGICGNQGKQRARTCTDPHPQYGGQECSGPDTETETCSEPHCSASVCFDSHTTFSESYRRESVGGCRKCDRRKVTEGSWYRFNLSTGENGVLDSCPESNACGTCRPIWMTSSHPTDFGVIKDVTMAVSVGGGHCSQYSGSGSVTKCSVDGDVFYLYKLWRPHSCPSSYCAGTYSFGED